MSPGVAISTPLDVAIIGAGPYALSLAANLNGRGVSYRIFGKPMQTWLHHVPKGMFLKSDGFASNLSAREPESTLSDYCRLHGLEYHDTEFPVPLKTFTDYALDFQNRFVPTLENKMVIALDGTADGFRLKLDDGETVVAKRVVVAVGISHFAHTPEELSALPAGLVSHSGDHHELEGFRGRDVTVIGGGASAVDLAALLHEAGAEVQIVSRKPLKFFSEPSGKPVTVLTRIAAPRSGIGPGWRSRLCVDLPHVFRYLPVDFRQKVVRRHLGPASAWGLKQRVVGVMPVTNGKELVGAEAIGGGVRLRLGGDGVEPAVIETGHVIAGTGYRADLRRLPFLSDGLRGRVKHVSHTPVLSSQFECSVPGLYFQGPIAANSFGPLMRFMVGSEFAAPRLSGHLVRVSK